MTWPVRIFARGDVAAASLLWSQRGAWWLTLVAKAHAQIVPDGELRLGSARPLLSDEAYEPAGTSPIAPAEIVPATGPAEITVHGYAYGHGGTEGRLRLAVQRPDDGETLIDKRIRVVSQDSAGVPRPFDKLRVGYEATYGGLGFDDNPIGMGHDGRRQPLLQPDGGALRPVSFGPVPAVFPQRKRLRGSLAREGLKSPVLVLPDDFDLAYFQTAPSDQRADRLAGDEQLLLEGMRAERAPLRLRLPGLRAVARIFAAPSRVVALPLDLRLVHLDTVRDHAALVWRAQLSAVQLGVDLPDAAASLTAAVQLVRGAQEPSWPGPPHDVAALERWGSEAMRHEPGAGDDGVITLKGEAKAAAFGEGTVVMSPHDGLEGTSAGVAQAQPEASPFAMARPGASAAHGAPPGAPFAQASAQPGPAPVDLEGTMVTTGAPQPATAPFDLARPGGSATRPDVPGAPWSNAAGRPVPLPQAPPVKRGQRAATAAIPEQPAPPPPPPAPVPPAPVDPSDVEQNVPKHAEEERAAAQVAARAEAAAAVKAQAEAEERARQEAERRAKAEADAKASAEAEARRREEAERFAEQQRQAELAERTRREEEEARRGDAAKKLRNAMYGGFKKR